VAFSAALTATELDTPEPLVSDAASHDHVEV
jgi:hypothetical protein